MSINRFSVSLVVLLSLGLSACSSDTPTNVESLKPAPFPADGAVLTEDFSLGPGTDAADSMVVFLDDIRLGVVVEPPFVWPVELVSHSPGYHAWTVTVYAGEAVEQLSAEVLMCHGTGLKVGNYAPTTTLVDLNGVVHTLGPSRDTRFVLLDFWATWCPPCRVALPETQLLFEVYGRQGLKVLTVNTEKEDVVRPFMLENEYTFPVLTDPQGVAFRLFEVSAIPTYYIIDHRGVVRLVRVGTGGTPLEEVIGNLM